MFYQMKKGAVALAVISLSLSTLTAACGGASVASKDASKKTSTGSEASSSNAGTGNGTWNPETGNNGTPSDDFAPAITHSFSMAGTGSFATPDIYTDNTLKIKVTAQQAGPISVTGYSNFSATYKCASFLVTLQIKSGTTWIDNQSIRTKALSVDGQNNQYACPDAAAEQLVDFSGRLTTGHGMVRIKVSAPRYDFYCQLLVNGYINPYYFNTYCSTSLYPMYQNHTAKGAMDIQINGSGLNP